MASIRTIDTTGDTKIEWDHTDPEQTKKAEEEFNRLKAQGYMFFRLKPSGDKGGYVHNFDENNGADLIGEFDPKADVVASKPVVGG